MTSDMRPHLSGLEALLNQAATGPGPAPVELWNPPYCGDIGLKIGRDGTWFYQDSLIGRMALVKLFARVLRRDADGRHYLVTPAEKVAVTVEDAPFVAVEMVVQGHGSGQALFFRTNIDDVVACGPDHPLRFVVEPGSGGLKPYVVVRGRLEALISRSVYYELVDIAVSSGDAADPSISTEVGPAGIWSNGAFFPLQA